MLLSLVAELVRFSHDRRDAKSAAQIEKTARRDVRLDQIGARDGLGDLLAEGSRLAAQRVGGGSDAFAPQVKGIHPTMVHAGVYAATLHYLKAVEAGKTDDGTKTIAKMKEMPTDDPLFGKGTIRADGRKIHPTYLFQVKAPRESRGAWDYYTTVATNPAEEAFRPMAEGNCPLVRS